MPRRRPGRLTPEDRALWDGIAAQVTPLEHRPKPAPPPLSDPAGSAAGRVPSRPPPKSAVPSPAVPTPVRRPSPPSRPSVTLDLSPDLPGRLARGAPLADRRLDTGLRRGKVTPDARIDLHGMTLAQAHPALIRFVAGARASGHRQLLVITGRGKDRDEGGPIPAPRGLLRHQVPHWLQIPPLAAHVLHVTPAHRRHGGEGAYYVRLRRDRG